MFLVVDLVVRLLVIFLFSVFFVREFVDIVFKLFFVFKFLVVFELSSVLVLVVFFFVFNREVMFELVSICLSWEMLIGLYCMVLWMLWFMVSRRFCVSCVCLIFFWWWLRMVKCRYMVVMIVFKMIIERVSVRMIFNKEKLFVCFCCNVCDEDYCLGVLVDWWVLIIEFICFCVFWLGFMILFSCV